MLFFDSLPGILFDPLLRRGRLADAAQQYEEGDEEGGGTEGESAQECVGAGR